nr:cAMP-dependent protein kinase inhibitor beta isoform X5 [Macaca nemestrina]
MNGAGCLPVPPGLPSCSPCFLLSTLIGYAVESVLIPMGLWESHAILKRHSIKRTLEEAGNPVPGTGKIGHLCHRPPWICTSMPFGVMRAQATAAQEAAAEETRKKV